jgi:hypothetical protein
LADKGIPDRERAAAPAAEVWRKVLRFMFLVVKIGFLGKEKKGRGKKHETSLI